MVGRPKVSGAPLTQLALAQIRLPGAVSHPPAPLQVVWQLAVVQASCGSDPAATGQHVLQAVVPQMKGVQGWVTAPATRPAIPIPPTTIPATRRREGLGAGALDAAGFRTGGGGSSPPHSSSRKMFETACWVATARASSLRSQKIPSRETTFPFFTSWSVRASRYRLPNSLTWPERM